MRPIPLQTRNELADDKFMKKCCLSDFYCCGRVEFHHNLIYGGRQSSIKETILPVCNAHHLVADSKTVKKRLNWIMLNRMNPIDIIKISKVIDYVTMKINLNKLYGNYA